ncbi:MAG: nucleotide exchange factor GrpE [Myxococcales bacterium]|nr:nucleotide exchange factor GrpE [Myxococcales bacterium]
MTTSENNDTKQEQDSTETDPRSPDAGAEHPNAETDQSENKTDTGDQQRSGSQQSTAEPDLHAICNARVARLELQLREKEKQVDDTLRAYRNVDEEFRRARERLTREQEKEIERQKGKVIAAFFEVADNLERSVTFATPSSPVEGIIEGMRMVHNQFMNKLVELGANTIQPVPGQPFDPDLHEAVGVVAVTDPAKHQTVVQLLRVGYRAGDTLLRPAMVMVGQFAAN